MDGEQRRAEVENFIKTFEWAKENGLECEFVESFLQDFESTKSIPSAIWFASCEWDL